jgi:hypothetical protein
VNDPRTVGTSAHPISGAAIGANVANQWTLSTVGDAEGSYKSVTFGAVNGGDIGSPGKTSFAAPVPLPAATYLLISGISVFGGALRRKRV